MTLRLINDEIKPKKRKAPETLLMKCPNCNHIHIHKELEEHHKVCKQCSYHFPLSAMERIATLLDKDSFKEYDKNLISANPLSFPNYEEKLKQDRKRTQLNDAVVTGEGNIDGHPLVIGVMDSRFRMGSMGSVVGEKILRAIKKAEEKRWPFILVSASGGARMQEGAFSLMQMAKTSAGLDRLHKKGILYISIMTHPTTGGVFASFSSLGDINIAEPGALLGFAGRRVIEQTVKERLPDNFQTSEFLLNMGQLDLIVPRSELRSVLSTLLKHHA